MFSNTPALLKNQRQTPTLLNFKIGVLYAKVRVERSWTFSASDPHLSPGEGGRFSPVSTSLGTVHTMA